MYAFHRSISWRSFSCQRFHYWKRSMRKHRLRSTPLGSANLTSLHKATMQFPSYVQREPCHFKSRSSRSSLSACYAICSELFSANLCLPSSSPPFSRIVHRKYASLHGVHPFSILFLDLPSFLRCSKNRY